MFVCTCYATAGGEVIKWILCNPGFCSVGILRRGRWVWFGRILKHIDEFHSYIKVMLTVKTCNREMLCRKILGEHCYSSHLLTFQSIKAVCVEHH